MEIEIWELNNIIKAAAKAAVEEFRITQNPTSDEISEAQAFKSYGTGWLKHQTTIGAAKWKRKGAYKNSPKIYSRSQLNELKYGINPLLQVIHTSNK